MNHDTFNANFYVTAATVIPVLFLGLTLQGSTLNNMLKRWEAVMDSLVTGGPHRGWSLITKSVVYSVLLTAAATIIIAGFAGEYIAITALYSQPAGLGLEPWVLFSVIALLIVVVAGPLLRFFVVYGHFMRLLWNELGDKPVTKAENEQETP